MALPRVIASHTVRLKIISNEIIKHVDKYESCMVSKLPIIFKRTHSHGVDRVGYGWVMVMRLG